MTPMTDPLRVLDSIDDGVYVTDLARCIVYWNKAAERLTRWMRADVVGRCCYDSVLCHVDKDGHQLCGQEHCPLHRSIVTGNSATVPIIVFAMSKDGARVPLRVSVAPVRAPDGGIIGGVEVFRDLSADIRDVERARTIQAMAMRLDLPKDPRISVRTHYIPCDVIGGDYHAMAAIDADRYGFLFADVCGHGVPAALYTMCLRSLWVANAPLLGSPREMAAAMNRSLSSLMQGDSPFATALCGVVDLAKGLACVAGAGSPAPLLFRKDGGHRVVDSQGMPLGIDPGAQYTETTVPVTPGDCLLMYSDGATEVTQKDGQMLGDEGLVGCLGRLGYPRPAVTFEQVEEAILLASDRIRFDDDLSFLELRFSLPQAQERTQ